MLEINTAATPDDLLDHIASAERSRDELVKIIQRLQDLNVALVEWQVGLKADTTILVQRAGRLEVSIAHLHEDFANLSARLDRLSDKMAARKVPSV